MSYNLFNPFVSLLSFTSLMLMAKPPPLAAFKLTLLLLVKMPLVIGYSRYLTNMETGTTQLQV